MDRGVIVGGLLISASFLVAVWLNRWAREETSMQNRSPAATECSAQQEPGLQSREVRARAEKCPDPARPAQAASGDARGKNLTPE